MQAVLTRTEIHTSYCATYWFKAEQPLRFEAGQYVQLSIPHDNPDSRGITRWMSLVNAPEESQVAITTLFPHTRPSTYKQALRKLIPGDVVRLGEIIGDFTLPKDIRVPLIFIVGGIGIAPVRSIISHLSVIHQRRDVKLLYSAGTEQDLLFENVFRNYKLNNYTTIVTRPSTNWHGQQGRLTSEVVSQYIGVIGKALVYLSGPQRLIEPLYYDLIARGIPRAQLILDYFPGY